VLKITLPIYFNKTELEKESLNSDCQQFHQYQQKEQPPAPDLLPQTTENKTNKKRLRHMALE